MIEAMCWRDLHDPKVGGRLDAEDFYQLGEAAGLDKKSLDELIKVRAYERLKKDLPA